MSEYDKLLEEELEKQKKKRKRQEEISKALGNRFSYLPTSNDFETVRQTTKDKALSIVREKREAERRAIEEDNEAWFKGGAFDDGYQFGDVTKTILGTVGDAGRHAVKGIFRLGEGIGDLVSYGIAEGAELFGEDEWAAGVKRRAQDDLSSAILGGTGDWLDQYSLLGGKMDSVAEGVGQVAGIWATAGLGSLGGLGATGTQVLTMSAMGASGVGHGLTEAFSGGATDEEAWTYGLISGVSDVVTEMLFSGMGKSIKVFGYGGGSLTGADDMLAKAVSGKIKNTIAKNAVQFGIKAGAEGVEEVLAGLMQAVGKKLTYMSEEDIGDIIADENLFEQFIVGMLTSSLTQSGDLVRSNKAGTDFITGYTQDDQTIFDKVVKDRIAEMEAEGKKVTAKDKATIKNEVAEDLEKGFISTKTIEEVLGGDQYTEYQNTIQSENDALTELAQLYEGDELKLKTEEFLGNSKRSELEKALSDSVFDRVKNSKISESYREIARRTERFTADLTKYDEKQRAVVQKAIDSGVLNNTNRTRDMVDWIARVSADTGVSFDFTNNEKLKDSIFAVNGKTVDGYITKDGIVINVNSPKYINAVVGHEITHVLEGTKLYEALESAVFEYAKANGTYKDVLKAAYDMYHDVDGYKGAEGLKAIKKEAVANMVGDYLFTDKKFINHLAAKNPNIFRKVWNEIKYMVKMARAGSDEAKKLLKVQKAFEEAYREAGKAEKNTAEDGGVRYSLMAFEVDGRRYVKIDQDQHRFDGHSVDEFPRIAKDIINEKFNGRVIGADNKMFVNGAGRDEFVNPSKPLPSEVHQAKMRTAGELDNLLDAGTNFRNAPDGADGHIHPDVIGGFDYFDTLFKIGDRYYEAVINIKNVKKGKLFKDVTKIKDVTQAVMSSYGNNPKSQFLRTSSVNSIRDLGADVKGKISIRDTDYLGAVNHGDMKTAQKMVDEAAKAAGYTVKAYHGTDADTFTVFDKGRIGEASGLSILGDGFYFSDKKSVAAQYGKNVFTVYLKQQNPYSATVDDTYKLNAAKLDGDGFDGVTLPTGKGTVYMVLDPEQIKSADPVTYDDNGNVIPLSERFKAENDDIRYSLSNEDALPIKQGNYRVAGEEIAYEEPLPMADSQTVTEAETPVAEAETPVAEAMTGEADLLPMGKQLEARLRESQKAKAEKDLKNKRALRELQLADFDSRIAEKEAELEAMPHKHSAEAKELRKEIEQLKKNRAIAEKNDARWIENAGALLENISKEAEIASSSTEAEATEKTAANGVASRSELHERIVGDIKGEFVKRGFDFDTVLKKAKNLSTFATVDNTPQRVMEKALGYKEGGILSDLTVNKVAQNETEGIKWLNSFTDRKHGLLKQISKQYGIKPGSKESAAAQMYAEGFYVNEKDEIIRYGDPELIQDFPDANVRRNIKGLARDPRIRQIYDETLAKINESRTRNAYPEIPRLDNYFLHFRAMEDTFSKLGLPFNPNDIRAKDLPTDLNGVTADLKPGQPYFASAMHRKGKRTSFDLLGGLERYLNSAKNQIYHIDDIQTLRALRNYIADTYGQANGLENLDSLSEEEAQQRIEQVYGSHLSTFAKFLNEEANVLAGKTALIDRGLEGIIGRRGITFLNTVNQQVGKNMVGFNVSSSLTNFLAPVQAFAKTNKFDFVKAIAQTAANRVGSIFGRNDGFADNSPVMIRRKGADSFHRTLWQKAGDAGYVLMSAVDNISTELIARAKYNELTRKGMDSQIAHIETDKWVSRLMGDRSLGQQPQLYNSKMLGIVTKFQLEVRNQLDSQFYDTIQEAKVSTEHIQNGLERNAKKAAKIASTFFQLAVAQHLFGKAFESIAGYNPAFDIISVITKTLGWDDDEDDEDTVLDNIEEGFLELLEDLPYTSIFTGGRIPISSALPIEEFVTGTDQYGNEKSRLETLGDALPYYILPGGYGQIKKTTQGLGMFDDDLPVSGSYTDSGNLRFPVEDTPWNRIQAGLFGQYASGNARDYFDNERQPLKPKQIQEYIDSDLPISDYWEYREGLSGLDSLGEKGDYIGDLDLPIATKNLFINNIAGREELIDMTNYSKYANFSEFDWAEQNKAKYAFLQEHGMSYADYENLDEDSKKAYSWAFNNPEKYAFIKEFGLSATDYYSLDEDSKDAYSWAYNNPESYAFSRAVTDDVVEYRQYASTLNSIKADKDANGKTVSGSRKDKVFDYIMGLDIDAGAKAILFKSEYPSEDSNNGFIIDYLNGREDISYSEMVAILKKLGFQVDSKGNISW